MTYTNQESLKHLKSAYNSLDLLKSDLEREINRLSSKSISVIGYSDNKQVKIGQEISYFESELCDIRQSMLFIEYCIKELTTTEKGE